MTYFLLLVTVYPVSAVIRIYQEALEIQHKVKTCIKHTS